MRDWPNWIKSNNPTSSLNVSGFTELGLTDFMRKRFDNRATQRRSNDKEERTTIRDPSPIRKKSNKAVEDLIGDQRYLIRD